MLVSTSYLMSCSSLKSQIRIAFELKRLAKLLCLSSIDEINWSHFTRADVIDLLGCPELRKRKAATQNFTLNVIKRLCEEACYAQLMPENLYLSIKRIPNYRGIRCQKLACLSKNDIFKMFASCINEGSLKGIRDAAILAVGLGCGLRRSEIAELRITNIDFTSSLIRVLGKGNRERYIGLNPVVRNYLLRWLRIRGLDGIANCFVPMNRNGEPITTRALNDESVYLVVQRRSILALGYAITTHDLRRNFASHMLANHVDINTLRVVMGHSDIRTTQIYDHRDELSRIATVSRISFLPLVT